MALGYGVLGPLPHLGIVFGGALLVGKEKTALQERGDGGDQGRGVWWERFQRAYKGTSWRAISLCCQYNHLDVKVEMWDYT